MMVMPALLPKASAVHSPFIRRQLFQLVHPMVIPNLMGNPCVLNEKSVQEIGYDVAPCLPYLHAVVNRYSQILTWVLNQVEDNQELTTAVTKLRDTADHAHLDTNQPLID